MPRSITASAAALALIVGLGLSAAADDGLQPPDSTVDSTLMDAGAEPLVDLVYRWAEGQTETAEFEMWVAERTSLGNMETEAHPPIPFRVQVSAEVEHLGPDGLATVVYGIEGVTLVTPATDDLAISLLADLETLREIVLREEYDAKGFVVRTELVDPLEDEEDLHPARELVLDTLAASPARLPLEPIGTGGTWEEVRTSGLDEPVVTATAYVKSLEDIDPDGRLKILTWSAVDAPDQQVPGDEMGLDEPVTVRMRGEGAQDTWVDLERLIPAWAGTYETKAEVDLPVGDGVTVTVDEAAAAHIIPGAWTAPEAMELPSWEVPLPAPEPATDGQISDNSGSLEVTLLDPGDEPRKMLRYDFEEGQVERSVTTMRTGIRAVVEDGWTDWIGLPPMEMAATTTVLEAFDDGTFLVEVVYTDVRVPTDVGQLPPAAVGELEEELNTLIGLRQMLQMDDRGRILDSTTTLPPGASTETLQQGQFDALTQELLDPLPEESVGVGAVWEIDRVTSDAMGFSAAGTNTVTLARVTPDGLLSLETDLFLAAEPGPMVIAEMEFMDATIDRFTTEGSGDKVIDLSAVNPVEGYGESVADYAFSIALGEESETTEMQMSMEIDAALISVEDG